MLDSINWRPFIRTNLSIHQSIDRSIVQAQGCFAATALLPLLLCVAALGIDEARVDESAQAARGAWEEGLKTLTKLKVT